MTGKELENWRRAMGLGKTEAAKTLGVTPNAYRAMARSEKVSERTELACIALWHRLKAGSQPWRH